MQQEPSGTVAAHHPALGLDLKADARWIEWQARGVANDRRSATRMRIVMLFVVAGLIAWGVVQLT